MNYRTMLLVIASVVLLIAITFIMYKQSANNIAQRLAEQTVEKQNWIVSNKYESEKLPFLNDTKESNDINITISESIATGSKSHMSINVLKND